MISLESEELPWGRSFVLDDEPPSYKLKIIEVGPGGRLSYLYHRKRHLAFLRVNTQMITIFFSHLEEIKITILLLKLLFAKKTYRIN